ncbi:MAG: methyltransferase domain-containing protein [Bauldia sp.]|nr:methyltransferase domain-containing protein [Bauldia sp.]
MRVGAIPETLLERVATLAGLAPTPVVDTLHAVIVARAVVTATRLAVFDALADAPGEARSVAAALGLHAGALEKLLNLLVAAGYLRYGKAGYDLAPLARKWLVSDSPQSLHDSMLLRLLEWQAIDTTEDFVRTGKALDVHDIIAGGQWDTYQRGMRALARLTAEEVVRRVKLPAGATAMLDIGGGHGAYSVAFCRAHPDLRATILDLPPAVAAAAPVLAEERMGGRVVHRAGDALTEDFGTDAWDLIFIAQLVHHFDAPTNAALVAHAATALRPGGRVAILDVLRPRSPNQKGQTGALLDLYFALTSNAGTWSAEEIAGWLADAGLRPARPIHLRTAPGISVVTATRRT